MTTSRVRTGVIAAVALTLTGTGAITATGVNAPTATPYPAEEKHAPSPDPDRVVLTPTETPATSQSVSWRTDASVTTAQAQIAPMGAGPSFKDAAVTVEATSHEPMQADLGYPVTFHTVTFEDLAPDSAYLYRVGDGENWTEWYEFTTASDSDEPFSFIYYGDAQNDIEEHVSRVFRRAYADKPEADIFLHAGDLVNVSTRDKEWGEWFTAAGYTNGMINSIATPGNHEYRSGELAPYWDKQFNFPANGPEAMEETGHQGTVFHTDYQGVRFVSLNTNVQGNEELMEAQAEYLDRALAENPGNWSVVTFHHPVFATTGTRDNQGVRKHIGPILEKHNVDLVLQGHDHSYARGNLVNDNIGRSGMHKGSVYVVSVSGPKMYQLNDGWNWTENGAQWYATTEMEQLYQLIDVTPSTISYQARTADGAFHDGFVIEKKGNSGKKHVYSVDENGKRIKQW